MIVYTAHVVTESADHYIWVYGKEPTRDQVIQRLHDMERAESLEWYQETTTVAIQPTEVLEN